MTTRLAFALIARQSPTAQIRKGLEQRNRNGSFAPGAQLPSEHGLCTEFGVSRPSIREAIRELMALGVVKRRGNRPHVVKHLPEIQIEVAERIDRMRELFETRRAIGIPIVTETTEAHLAIAMAIISCDAEKVATMAFRHLDDVERRMVAQSRLANAPRSGAGSMPIASP